VVSANVFDSNPTPGKVLDFVRGSDADLVVLVDAESDRWREVLAALGDLYPHRAPDAWREGAPVVHEHPWNSTARRGFDPDISFDLKRS
jgi:hypothetical protein